MSEIERYDVLVLGSGESGKYMAWTMAKAGHRTAVIERKLIGGSCPNVACLPNKNVIRSANVASLAKRGEEFGDPESPRSLQGQRSRIDHGYCPIRGSQYRGGGSERRRNKDDGGRVRIPESRDRRNHS